MRINISHRSIVAIGVALVVAVGAAAGCAVEEESSGAGDAGAGKAAQTEARESPNKATDDYTPHVRAGQPVIVDTLTWRVTGARTASRVGGEYFGEDADGVFVIVDATVRNGKDESVTLSSDQITLTANGKTYETDNDGTVAAMGEGAEPFFLKDLGPDVSAKGIAVFDVPQSILRRSPEVCFGELGFGSGTGCIRLPAV